MMGESPHGICRASGNVVVRMRSAPKSGPSHSPRVRMQIEWWPPWLTTGTTGTRYAQRQLDEPLAPGEVDAAPIGPRPEALVVAAGIDEHREPGIERARRVRAARGDLADLPHERRGTTGCRTPRRTRAR